MISSISHRGVVGDLAVIFDNDHNFVAIGLWDPVRRSGFGSAPWQARHHRHSVLAAARERRRSKRRGTFSGDTDGYRVLNGEDDGFPD